MAVDVLPSIDSNNNSSSTRNENLVSLNNERNIALTAFARLTKDLSEDERCLKELSLGKRIGFYRLRGDLGSGNFAKVKLGYHCLVKEKVAVKILDKTKLDEKTQRLLSREILSMEKLHHPNIIRIFEVLETYSKIYMIVEYASSGELFHKILNEGKFSEAVAKTYFAQIITAISHMHARNIIHRDIKAENVFLNASGCVKIGDLGFSTMVESPEQQLNTFCGSPPYAAPELFKDDYYLGKFVDIWALGILLYFMVTGVMPFRADTVGKLKRKILEGSYTIPDHVSEQCRFLISQILRPVPIDRCTMPEIMRSLWIEGTPFPKDLESHTMRPCLDSKNSCVEEEGIEQLLSYGVTKEMMLDLPDTCRHNINGSYRLAVYQAEKRVLQRQLEKEAIVEHELNELKLKKDKGKKSANAKNANSPTQSKFCTIL